MLSEAGVEFEDRNLARSAVWRAELLARRGELVVPVLCVGDQEVVGYDEARIRELLRLSPASSKRPAELAGGFEGLDDPLPTGCEAGQLPQQLGAQVAHLLSRIQREMEHNAAKGATAYRQGQHDGMRFCRDALRRILEGSYEPEDPALERARGEG